jgi:Putative transposase, YhgA-like
MPNAPKSDIQSPHGGFTWELLSRIEIATDFLRHYLPPEIVAELDLTTVEKRKETGNLCGRRPEAARLRPSLQR